MKKYILWAASFAALLLAGLVQAGQGFDLEFVYCQSGCKQNPVTVSAYNDGQVLPYASLKLAFDHRLTDTEKAEFVSHFRLTKGIGEQVLHLHEKISDLPVSGQQSSFTWSDGGDALIYTASSLPAGDVYTISIPSDWSENQGVTSFSTMPLTGDGLRTYEVFCPDAACYEKLTNDAGIEAITLDQTYADVVFEDTYADKTYQDTEMRIRGFSSTWVDKKSYTVKFDSDELFEGFKDSSGTYQGPRKKLVFVAHKIFGTPNLSANKLMNDVARKLGKRVFGAELEADSYFALVAFNGRFWGVYNVSEHIGTGKGGWSTMADRTETLDFHDKGKGMLHKATWGSFDLGDNYIIEPKTDHEYEFSTRGDGVQRHWMETIPFNVYYEEGDFDFEVAAKGPKMKLKPNIEQSSPPAFFVLSGDGTGSLDIFDTETDVVVDFEQAVEDDEKIEAEFNSIFDFQTYYRHIQGNRNYAAVEDWFHVDSSLISMFVVRASGSWDHGVQNRYMFSREKRLEDFRDASQAPDGHRYYDILWDGDLTFNSTCVPDFISDIAHNTCRISRPSPLHWKIVAQSQEGRQRFIDLFDQERRAGGVLTPEYYQQQIQEHLAILGNALELEALRWNRSFDYDALLAYTDNRFGDSDFIENKLLSLDIDQYLPPSSEESVIHLEADAADQTALVESRVYDYTSDHPDGFTQVYFLADSADVGPVTRRWREQGYSPLSVPVQDEQGQPHILNLRGIRVRHWHDAVAMNTGQNYYHYTDAKFRLEYHRADNLHLDEGRYTTVDDELLGITAHGWHRHDFNERMLFRIDVTLPPLPALQTLRLDSGEATGFIDSEVFDFTEQHQDGFTQVYFLAASADIGPISRRKRGRGRYTLLNVPVYDTSGTQHILKLRGIRIRHWQSQVEMNTAVNYYHYTDAKFRLAYHKEDNSNLPVGQYQTRFGEELYIQAKGWHRDYSKWLRYALDISIDF